MWSCFDCVQAILVFGLSQANVGQFCPRSTNFYCFDRLEQMLICFELPRLNCDVSNVSSDWIYLDRAQPAFFKSASSSFGQVSTVLDQNLMLGASWANVVTFRQLATKFWCLGSLGQMWVRFDCARSSFDVSTVSIKCGVVLTAFKQFWFLDCLKQMWVNFVHARPIFIVLIVSKKCWYVLNFLG